MPVPDFSPGEVLTAQAMDSIGLWKIIPSVSGTGTSVSGSSVILTAAPEAYITAFSADFKNYRIIASFTGVSGAGAVGISFRPSNGTTPNTTAGNYRSVIKEQAYANGTIVTGNNNGISASLPFSRYDGVNGFSSCSHDFLNPFDSANNFSYNGNYRDNSFGGDFNGFLTVTTSYSGFNIRVDGTRTLTGRIDIYGYK